MLFITLATIASTVIIATSASPFDWAIVCRDSSALEKPPTASAKANTVRIAVPQPLFNAPGYYVLLKEEPNVETYEEPYVETYVEPYVRHTKEEEVSRM